MINKIPFIGAIVKWLQNQGLDYGLPLVIWGFIQIILLFAFFNLPEIQIIAFLAATAPIWLPIMTGVLFFSRWMFMIGLAFAIDNGRTTLEIKLPPEVYKSPEAIEVVISQIHNVQNPENLFQTYLDGKRPLTNSLEIVSKGGDVRFYINIPIKKIKTLLKADLYSQYPGIEIQELNIDYTAEIPNDLNGYEMMSFHMGKKNSSAFPIRTYKEFGMDKLPKEEEKIDPLTPLLEAIGSIQPYERVWIQILITPHRERGFKYGQLKKSPTWEKEVSAEVEKIMKKRSQKRTMTDGSEYETMTMLTPVERNTIELMEENAQHYAYETAIRWIYITPTGKFNGDTIGCVIRPFSQWDVQGRNGIGVRWRTDFNYKFYSDPFGTLIPALKKSELKSYKLRKYFNYTPADNTKIFTSVELASVYHFPGKVAVTPSLSRVTSTRGEAPGNLPTGNYEY